MFNYEYKEHENFYSKSNNGELYDEELNSQLSIGSIKDKNKNCEKEELIINIPQTGLTGLTLNQKKEDISNFNLKSKEDMIFINSNYLSKINNTNQQLLIKVIQLLKELLVEKGEIVMKLENIINIQKII